MPTLIQALAERLGHQMPPLGSGGRFKGLVKKLSGKPGVKDSKALAAALGRKKWGAKKMAHLAASGRRRMQ